MTTGDEQPDRLELLERFHTEVVCTYTQRKAAQAWRLLTPYLADPDRKALLIAWDMFLIGKGRGELDTVCSRIQDQWKMN